MTATRSVLCPVVSVPATTRPRLPSQQLLRDREAGGIDRHRLLVAPLLHGLAEAVVWHELATRKPLVCARRAKPSLPEPVLDGTAAVGVAVQGDDWVNHLLMGDWAHKGLWHCIVFHEVSAFPRPF